MKVRIVPTSHCFTFLSFQVFLILLVSVCAGSTDFSGADHANDHQHAQLSRVGRQEDAVPGGVDFSSCLTDSETGLCCVDKEETVTSLEKEPIVECTHKNTEQCHYTYVTQLSQPNSTSTGVGA